MHVCLQGVSEVSEMKIANFVNILASYLSRVSMPDSRKMHQAGDSLKILYLSDNVKIKIQQIQ